MYTIHLIIVYTTFDNTNIPIQSFITLHHNKDFILRQTYIKSMLLLISHKVIDYNFINILNI